MSERHYTAVDRLIGHLDQGLRTVFGNPPTTGRPYPAEKVADTGLATEDRRHAAGLMRVNHCGEVCAQALYQGQALTARSDEVGAAMRRAADEENDHLAWCRSRLTELDSRTSLLDPAFYLGSLTMGIAAGTAGDRWSLGFVAETERQVVTHLSGHLGRLPESDLRSRAIVEQMRIDEGEHAEMAVGAGARELPGPIKGLMRLTARVMTTTTYRI